MLDAIQAFSDGDYRRSILYSAIAIETIASTKLDETYKSILEQNNSKNSLRIVSIQQAGGKKIIKDPIYEYLSSRTDFGQLLHERPLYLFGKSLMIENERLYQIAKKLYATRNKIAHLGNPPSGDNLPYFSICEIDAKIALECVTEIFEWFGEPAQYIIPDNKFSSVSEIALACGSG